MQSLALPLLFLVVALLVGSSQAHSISTISSVDANQSSLTKVMDMIKIGVGRPSAQDIINAYNEYVSLHKLQNDLADSFGEQQPDRKGADEQQYLEVSELLKRPELQLINQNLFNLLQEDYTLTEVSMSPKLEEKLEATIRSLFV